MSSEWGSTLVDDMKAPSQASIAIGPFGSRMKSDCYVAQGVKVVRGTNISSGRTFSGDFVFVTSEKAQELGGANLRPNDLVFPHRGSIGEVGIVPDDGEQYVISSSLMKLTCDPLKAFPLFIYYFFKSENGRYELLKNASQVGTPGIGQPLASLKSISVPLPPLNEQKNIAAFLGALDDRISLLSETNATLEAIAQALFKSWFVDFDPVRAKAEGRQPEGMDAPTAALFPDSFEESELGLVPKGWSVVRLGDVTERITKGTTPTTLKRPFVESGINFVKVESITDDGQLLPEKFAYIDDETHCLLGRSQLKADDVLITIAGTIGRVAVITEDFIPANTNQAVAIVRPDTSKLPSAFVNQFLRLADSKSRMGERVVQAVQANLSLGSLSDMKLVMPPSELVTKLHDLVFDSIGSKRNSNQQRIRTLTQLRDTLLPRLISGQLRLSEAETLVEEVV